MARAIVDIRKLTGYCLNSEHPRGRHKARVFAAVLGITVDHAEELRHLLLANAAAGDARLSRERSVRGSLHARLRRGPRSVDWACSKPLDRSQRRAGASPDHLLRPHLKPEASVDRTVKLLAVVALLRDLPEAGLERGQVGTGSRGAGGGRLRGRVQRRRRANVRECRRRGIATLAPLLRASQDALTYVRPPFLVRSPRRRPPDGPGLI